MTYNLIVVNLSVGLRVKERESEEELLSSWFVEVEIGG